MIKARKLFAAVLFTCLFSTLIFGVPQRASAPNKSWETFWRQFSAAVNNKDRVALKALMSSEKDFFSGGGGENRDQWIQLIVRQKAWRELQKSVASGTMPLKDERGPSRITKDKNLIFTLIGGKWRFVGVMGD
jgi:hypothetical protein